MEEIAGSFFDNYEEGFLEYLEVHKAQALKDREDYQTLNKKISELAAELGYTERRINQLLKKYKEEYIKDDLLGK